MTVPSFGRQIALAARLATGVTTMLGCFAASAASYQLTYTGSFDTTEGLYAAGGPATNFTAVTPFTIRAVFDDASPNQLPDAFPFLGFHAYIPSVATIEIGGSTYSIETAATNAAAGITVSIFDRTQIFYNGIYGVGFIADVVNDGAGIVGDFSGASPDFTVDALTPTTFTGYNGVGHGSGTCNDGNPPPGCSHNVTPWVLRDASNNAFSLQLGNYEEEFHDGGYTLNTATITAVPEPATAVMFAGGLLALAARRRRASAPG